MSQFNQKTMKNRKIGSYKENFKVHRKVFVFFKHFINTLPKVTDIGKILMDLIS